MKNRRNSRAKQLGFWGAVIGGAASLLGGAMSNKSNERNTAISYEQTKDLRQTAYQDTTKDLVKAGLNPMLAYQNSATPAPAMPVAQNKNIAEGMANSAAAAESINNIKAQNKVLDAQAAKLIAETEAIPTSTANVAQNTKNLQATIPKIEQEIANMRTQNLTEQERVALTRSQNRLTQIQEDLAKKNISFVEAQTRTQDVLTQLKKYEIPGAKNMADFEQLLETGSGNAGKLGQMGARIGSILTNSARKVMGK